MGRCEGANLIQRADAVLPGVDAFNFLIGGLSGVVLSDVPTDTGLHGSLLRDGALPLTRSWGGLIFSFFAGIYYWVPKMTGLRFKRAPGPKVHFWLMFVGVQLHLPAAVRAGPEGDAKTGEHL